MKNCIKCNQEFEPRYKNQSLCDNDLSLQGRRNKRKGAMNEHRFSKYLQEQFIKYELPYRVQRTPRSGGIAQFENADLMFGRTDINSIFSNTHFELKDTAHFYIEEWIKDAKIKEENSGKNRMPVLIIRKPNSQDEFAVMDADKLMEIFISLELYRLNSKK